MSTSESKNRVAHEAGVAHAVARRLPVFLRLSDDTISGVYVAGLETGLRYALRYPGEALEMVEALEEMQAEQDSTPYDATRDHRQVEHLHLVGADPSLCDHTR